MISLRESATFPSRPVQSEGRRTEKFPVWTAVRQRKTCRRANELVLSFPAWTWPFGSKESGFFIGPPLPGFNERKKSPRTPPGEYAGFHDPCPTANHELSGRYVIQL